MRNADAGVMIRDGYLIVGYFKDWLVAQDQNEELWVMDEPEHIYEPGTYCDSDSILIPARNLSENDYETFSREFLGEV
ncbi:MAG: hypothetical protein PHY47_27320 [Lachnospiraceae bacterium]|nr:hypothetical protein [Lachnospiraceae bacterium]